MLDINLYTDGACSPNPGLGGWAAYFIYNNVKYVTYGYEENSTNNRMELTAVIEGLRLIYSTLKKLGIVDYKVHVYSDSQYVVNTMNSGWKRNANKDLWDTIDGAIVLMDIDFIWVKGHASNPGNNECDKLAVKARTNKEIKSYAATYKPELQIGDIVIGSDGVKQPNNVIKEPKLYVETPNQVVNVPSNYHYNKDKYAKNEELLYKCKDLILELDDKIHPLAELLRSEYCD